MREPEVSVVVVNWNGAAWLPRCLEALRRQRGIQFETVLVDNGSTDGSVELVAASFPEVRIVRLPSNEGFAGGNNAGVRAARARLVAFLNNDTEADPGWLRALADALCATPHAALAASRIVFMDRPGVIDSAGDGWLRAGSGFKRGHGSAAGAWEDQDQVFGACGAACMIRRDAFEAVGGFDEEFFLLFEDVDLSYRVRLAGWTCVYVPAARVLHASSATIGRLSSLSVFYGQRNVEWVYFGNTPRTLLWRTLPGHVLYVLAAAVYFAWRRRLAVFLRAKWAALRGVAVIVRKRRAAGALGGDAAALSSATTRGWSRIKWAEKRPERRASAPPPSPS